MLSMLTKSPMNTLLVVVCVGVLIVGVLMMTGVIAMPGRKHEGFADMDNNSELVDVSANTAEEEAMEEAMEVNEGFENNTPIQDTQVASGIQEGFEDAAAAANNDANNQLPSECYPKDVLSSADLLPSNSLHSQVVPSSQGALTDQNFLTAGYHIGINTVGQTLRNANRQLRSEPPNTQQVVSPWNQTTIEPDINRRPLEIGSGN